MKKFVTVCVMAVAAVAARNVVAAEQTDEAGVQTATDIRFVAVTNEPIAPPASPAPDPICQAGCAPLMCDGYAIPRIAASVNELYMQRHSPSDAVIFSGPSGATLLNASQFDFCYRPGIDASLTYNRNCDYGIDLRYEWLAESGADASFTFPAGVNHTNTTPPSYFGGGSGGAGHFDYQSGLQTAEVNLRKHFYWFDGLIGFRYADLGEGMNGAYTFHGLRGVETQSWNAQNNLYGLQVGADALLWQSCRGIRIDGYGKAGIYGNVEETQFQTNYIVGGSRFADADTTHAAFLGELGFTASWQLTRHLAWQTGYQMLWLDGVATAGKQVSATGSANPPPLGATTSHVDSASTVFYQGFKSGLEVTW